MPSWNVHWLLVLMAITAQVTSAPAQSVKQSQVVLIHGIGDDSSKMERLRRHLVSTGREVHALALRANWGQSGIDSQAEEVRQYVDAHLPQGERFDLIGFSMGGIVARYYVQRLGGLERVRRLVTVSSPHRGTIMAYLLGTKASRQMRPGSAFLRDLASDAEQLARVGFTSFWTPFDLIILPASSSIVRGAKCHRVWCLAHPLMVAEPRCLRAITASLDLPLSDSAAGLPRGFALGGKPRGSANKPGLLSARHWRPLGNLVQHHNLLLGKSLELLQRGFGPHHLASTDHPHDPALQ